MLTDKLRILGAKKHSKKFKISGTQGTLLHVNVNALVMAEMSWDLKLTLLDISVFA